MNKQAQIEASKAYLLQHKIPYNCIGIILGTGLGDLVEHLDIKKEISYAQIPNFPKSTMEFHKARLIYGTLNNKDVLVFEGRFHAYEGLSYFEITYPIRLMNAMKCSNAIISNAAGSINLSFKKGELMLIEDHINLQSGSPIAEKGIEELGNRFVDMSSPYSKSMTKTARSIANEQGIPMHSGVYVAVTGPQLETKAEYRYLKIIGADAVGMSTVPEVIVANQLGIPCIAFSVITDECDPDHLLPINIEDIMASAKKAEQFLILLVKELISTLE